MSYRRLRRFYMFLIEVLLNLSPFFFKIYTETLDFDCNQPANISEMRNTLAQVPPEPSALDGSKFS